MNLLPGNRMIGRHGKLPETAEAVTGGGGRHLHFRIGPRRRVCNRVLDDGLELKGDGGCIAVEPSLHPETGDYYFWLRHPSQGIAKAPAWLMRLVAPGKQSRTRTPSLARPLAAKIERRGDVGVLLAEMLSKFPIPGHGHRHTQMVRAVGGLVGRGFADDVVRQVMMGWWEHFYERGRVRTGRLESEKDLADCIRRTRRNPKFQCAMGDEWHRNQCQRIRLNDRQRRLLAGPIPLRVHIQSLENEPDGPLGLAHRPCKTVIRIGDRLCISDAERLFVEALIVYVTHRRNNLNEDVIQMTDGHILKIAVDRRGADWRPWDNQQIERLKRKNIGRPDRPATVCELLWMTIPGQRGKGRKPGTPSVYETTGIERLLSPRARRPALIRAA